VTRLSEGPAGGNDADLPSHHAGNTPDGRHVFFTTREKLVDADSDGEHDLYRRSGGTSSLVAVRPPGTTGGDFAGFAGVSQDGSRVLVQTDKPLAANDTDNRTDIYERVCDGAPTLISTGPNGGNVLHGVNVGRHSADAAHVYFETTEQLVAEDNDSSEDVYLRSGAQTTLVSAGPAGDYASVEWVSPDGSRAIFSTDGALAASDRDSTVDLYEWRRSDGSLALLSTGPSGGGGAFHAEFRTVSGDGNHVYFVTSERLADTDTDSAQDIYERSAGATEHISIGPAGGNAEEGATPPTRPRTAVGSSSRHTSRW